MNFLVSSHIMILERIIKKKIKAILFNLVINHCVGKFLLCYPFLFEIWHLSHLFFITTTSFYNYYYVTNINFA